MNKKIEKLCLAVIRWGSCLILFLPLLVYRQTLYPFIFGKIIGFRILVEIIFVAWLFLAIYDKKYRPDFRNLLVLSLTIFMLMLVLTMFTGININRSFWSTQERMTGVLTMLHFWLWFIILTSTFGGSKRESAYSRESENDWKEWRRLIWASLICCFLVGLYGLGQKIGLKFLLKESDIRMSATLGNPIYLGVYSMLHIFLAGGLLIQQKKWFWRIILLFLLFFNLIIMLLTASRGVMIASGLSLLLFFIYLIFTLSSRKTKLALVSIVIVLIAVIIGGTIFLQNQKRKPWIYKAPVFIQRIVYLTGSIEQRTIAWQTGIEGFKERPILGWGWENYNVIFNKYYNPYYLRIGQENTWFDRSHNQMTDLLSLTGVLGTLAYLIMYGTIFWLLLRKKAMPIRESMRMTRIGLVILALMFLSYFIQNLTVFDTPAPLIVFYFSLGLTYFITTKNTDSRGPNADSREKNANKKLESSKFPLPILIFLIIIFLPWAMYKFNLEPFQQSKTGIIAYFASRNDLKTGLEWSKKALAKPIFTNQEIRLLLAKGISEQQNKINSPEFQKALDFIITELEKTSRESPLDVKAWLTLGQIYNIGASYNRNYLEKAENVLKKALELSPKRQQVYFELARTKIFQKEYDEAIQFSEKAVELDDQIGEAHFNLGLAYLFGQKLEDGLAEVDKAQILGYPVFQNSELNVLLAQNYAKSGQAGRALDFIDKAINAQPENLNYLAQKIIICHQVKYAEMAQNLLEELKVKDANLATEVEEYLKTLK